MEQVTPATQRAPKPTREMPRRRRRLALAGATVAGLALVAVGVALAVDLSGGGGGVAATTTQRTESEPTTTASSPAAPVVTSVAYLAGDPGSVRLRLSGKPLRPGTVRVRDADISDGHAWFELAQTGIGARTQGSSSTDVRVRVRKATNRVRIDLATDRDLERAQVRRVDGRTVVVTFTKPPPTTTGSTSSTGSTGGTETTTTPPPTKPDKPVLKTG
jgi:hypothetical protein